MVKKKPTATALKLNGTTSVMKKDLIKFVSCFLIVTEGAMMFMKVRVDLTFVWWNLMLIIMLFLQLKSHPKLANCKLEDLGNSNGIGRLIWARNPGSVYWPALIASFEDKPGRCSSE